MLKGYDKEGDPIYVERLGVTDAPGLLSKLGEDEHKLLASLINRAKLDLDFGMFVSPYSAPEVRTLARHQSTLCPKLLEKVCFDRLHSKGRRQDHKRTWTELGTYPLSVRLTCAGLGVR